MEQPEYHKLAEKCDELSALLRDTARYELTAWKWVTANKAQEVVDTITILNIESLGD